MKKNLIFLMSCLCLLWPNMAMAGLHDYPDVAVLPYANKAAVSRELSLADASLVSEFVIEQLLDSERFNVVERDQLLAITNEYSLNMTGLVDPSTMVQVGRLAGAKYLVAGSVTGLSTKRSGLSYENSMAGGLGGNMNTVIANVTARIIDVETGRIVLAASGTGESASTNAEFHLKTSKTDSIETTGYDDMTDEEYIMEGEETTFNEHRITIGTTEFSQVQVRNALYKAVYDLVNNKNYGIVAKMNGKAKKRKV